MSVLLDTAAEGAKAANLSAVEAIADCFNRAAGVSAGEDVIVPFIIFNRISQIHWGIVLLAERRLFPEAMILAATEFELLLDLLFIELKSGRATKWLEHPNSKISIWPMATKINSVFKKTPERKAAAHKMYEIHVYS